MTSVLSARSVVVRKGDEVLLEGIDLEVHAGEWLCIVGANGAGKSTLLRCLAGVEKFEGSISSSLLAAHDDRRRRAKVLAYVPQQAVIPEQMTVFEFALLGRRAHLSALAGESAEDHAVVAQCLEQLEIAGLSKRTMSTLSGGERQRAVLAQALSQQTPLLILDEPTTGLDIGHREQLLGLLADIRKQRDMTVVMSMHDLPAAASYSERMMLMSDGQITATGAPVEVLTDGNLASAFGVDLDIRWIDGECFLRPRRRALRSST